MKVDFAFLDSGTGGIPYMLELKKKNPNVTCLYLGDTANFPYGEKTPSQIIEASARVMAKMQESWNPKVLIIACNTISVTALDELRKRFPFPIVGTVPAIKLASKVSRNKCIGLLATNATVRHPYCQALINDFASDCRIVSRGDPDLIEYIEHDLFTSNESQKDRAVSPAVNYFKSNGCDTIILGCTHFTHVAKEIQRVAGPDLQVVDSRDGVSNHALDVFYGNNFIPESADNLGGYKDMTFFVTDYGSKENTLEYETLCRNFNIPWGGLF